MVRPNLFEPGDVFGIYQIEEHTSNDGPLQSYFATNTLTQQKIDLLCVDSRPSDNTAERIEAFQAMAARLRAIDGPFLAKLYDAGVTDRIYWAATEYIDPNKLPLAALLGDPDERFTPVSCFHIALQTASALRAASKKGVLHLRLSPDRIVVNREHKLLEKITGFGIAQLFSLPPAMIRSEPGYAAPEQLRDKSKAIDERADIYAFGMVLYALFAWAPPFADRAGKLPNNDRLLFQAMTRTPPALMERMPLCPDFLDVFVQSLIAKARSNRPRKWDTAIQRLDDIVARYDVWVDTMEEIGKAPRAAQKSLIEGLRGPAREKDELLIDLVNIIADTAGIPIRKMTAQKRTAPQSTKLPVEALRLGIQGYCPADNEDAEEEWCVPEPEWISALPEEPEAIDDAADEVGSASSPNVSAVPSSTSSSEAPTNPKGAPRGSSEHRTSVGDRLSSAPPVDALPHDTLRDPAPPTHRDASDEQRDGEHLDPVTLPSAKVGQRRSVHPAHPRRVVLAVATLVATSLIGLAFLFISRGLAKPALFAQSADLRAAARPELYTSIVIDEANAPRIERLPTEALPIARSSRPPLRPHTTPQAPISSNPRPLEFSGACAKWLDCESKRRTKKAD